MYLNSVMHTEVRCKLQNLSLTFRVCSVTSKKDGLKHPLCISENGVDNILVFWHSYLISNIFTYQLTTGMLLFFLWYILFLWMDLIQLKLVSHVICRCVMYRALFSVTENEFYCMKHAVSYSTCQLFFLFFCFFF